MQMNIINKSFVLILIGNTNNKNYKHSHFKKVILLIDGTTYSLLSLINNVERKQIDTKGNWLSFFSIQFGHYLEKMGLNFPT